LKANSVLLEDEAKFVYNKVVPNAENKVCFEVRYRSKNTVFLPEQIVAMMLKKLQADCQKSWSSTQRLRSFCAIILHWRGKKGFP